MGLKLEQKCFCISQQPHFRTKNIRKWYREKKNACSFCFLLLWFHFSLQSCLTQWHWDLELSQLFFALPIGRITFSLQSEQQLLLIFPYVVRIHLFKKFLTAASLLQINHISIYTTCYRINKYQSLLFFFFRISLFLSTYFTGCLLTCHHRNNVQVIGSCVLIIFQQYQESFFYLLFHIFF